MTPIPAAAQSHPVEGYDTATTPPTAALELRLWMELVFQVSEHSKVAQRRLMSPSGNSALQRLVGTLYAA